MALRHLRGIVQESAAIGDAGERVDHGGGAMTQFGAFLRHRQQDEGDRDREQQRLERQYGQPHAAEHAVVRRPWQHRDQRRAQQKQRAMREQHEDRRPARNQLFLAAAPEFVSREPGIGGDDGGREQGARIDRIRQHRQAADQEPDHGAGDHVDRLDRAAVENARAGPGDREGGKQQRVGESMLIRSGAEPNMPNSTTEKARIRWAKPHQATARIAVFCAQANSSNRPRMAST